MMQIVYFSQKQQFLAELQATLQEKVFITPSPAKADSLRGQIKNAESTDVITIAKFTGDLFKKIIGAGEEGNLKRKADLLLIFGILKNKYLPDLGFEQFIQAYNLFSDLRSFSLNEDALTSVMDEQPEEIKKAVGLFWKLLELTGYLDEHGAYQKISEGLRSSEEHEDLKKVYVFWGFQHLNGQQVDLLKALAIRYQVIIPFPLELKQKIKRSDWISWLKDSKVEERELEHIDIATKASWLPINSREISLHLKNELREGDQIVLGVSKLTPLHMDLIPSLKVSFKVPHQLVEKELKELSAFLANKLEVRVDLQQLVELLQQKTKSVLTIKKGEIPNYKFLKAIQLYQESLKMVQELTDEAISVDGFFLKLLNEVVMLNQPRTSFVPLSGDELNIDFKDMSSLEDIKKGHRVILCIDEKFDEIQSLGQNYSETIQKSLSALGPLKRNELELQFKKWEFKNLMASSEVLVMMSESTMKHSLIWKKMFEGIELELVSKSGQVERRPLVDHYRSLQHKAFMGDFSASKFQSFLDCPRKFYFSYVDKIFPAVSLENDLDSLTIGSISHKVVELFHKRKLNDPDLPALVKEVMDDYIQEKQLALPLEVYIQHELIFNQRSFNGIQFLRNVEQVLQEKIEWLMEEDFKFEGDFTMKGKIDCIGLGERSLLLIDFKSTKFAASTNKEVEEFESLQLWAYALASQQKYASHAHKAISIGYVSLDNPQDSNLLMSDADLFDKFKKAKICKQHLFKSDFSELLKQASEKMTTLAATIKSEQKFPANPRKVNACRYCELTKVCIKSELIP